ncbi:MAG: putative sulfate exporter family transporter, partial [Candidatus Thiodiazotropha sp.]
MLDLDGKNGGMVKGIAFVTLLASIAYCLTLLPILNDLHISPLLVGLILGIVAANTIGNRLPVAWRTGILFSTKNILRIAIVFYGFRITFQDIASVGLYGIAISVMVVTMTFIMGYLIGTRL